MIVSAGFWLLSIALVVTFVARAWRTGRPARQASQTGARQRVVRSGIDALVLLAMVRALFPPPGWASWLWVLAVVGVGIGIAGVIVRWRELQPSACRWPTVAYAVAGAGLVALLA